MGDVTTNIGIYDNENAGLFGINLRYPEGFEFEKLWIVLQMRFNNMAFEVKLGKVQPPHYVDKMILLYKS